MTDLNTTVPAGSLVYVGDRTFRNGDEPEYTKELIRENNPEAVREELIAQGNEHLLEDLRQLCPHTFIDFSGVRLVDILEHAGGKQGCVVDLQKQVRIKSTLNEVKAWRRHFRAEDYADQLDECANVSQEVLDEIAEGYPFVVVSFQDAGKALDVPAQPQDMLDEIKTKRPAIWKAVFEGLGREEQLKIAPPIWSDLKKS